MQNETQFHATDRYIRPFSVLLMKIFIETLYFSLVYFAAEKIIGFHNNLFLITAVMAFVLIRIAVFLPLYFGTVLFFCRRVFFGISEIKAVFYFFSPRRFLSSVKSGLLMLLFRFLCLAVFFIPGLSMLGLVWYNIINRASVISVLLSFAAFVLLLLIGISAFSKATKLAYLFEYIFVLNPGKKTAESFQKSIELMKGKTHSVTAVKFGNFFRLLLCTAIIPIGFVWNSCQKRKAILAKKILSGQES